MEELAAFSARRAPLLEHYAKLRSARIRREEIERELRLLAKPIEAHRLATMKMAMVKEELAMPAVDTPDNPDAATQRQMRYREVRREILKHEEGRLAITLSELRNTMDRATLLSEELGGLAMAGDNIEYLVEEIQRDYNVKAEELRRLDARIELEGAQ